MKLVLALLLLVTMVAHGSSVISTMTEGTATTTSTLAKATNVNRKYLMIQNRGVEDIYIKTASVHTGGQVGIIIVGGGSWEPVDAPMESIYIKSASSTSDYTIIEGI